MTRRALCRVLPVLLGVPMATVCRRQAHRHIGARPVPAQPSGIYLICHCHECMRRRYEARIGRSRARIRHSHTPSGFLCACESGFFSFVRVCSWRLQAGACTGAIGGLVGSPFFLVKARLQNSGNPGARFTYNYTGLLDGFRQVVLHAIHCATLAYLRLTCL